MRLHTSNPLITPAALQSVLNTQKQAGRIHSSVHFKTLTLHNSRTHSTAIEVQLTAFEYTKGRRRGNDGAYGAMTENFAATYDEWGWLIAALYEVEPTIVWGTVKHPIYAGRDDFDHKTGMTYNPAALLSEIEDGDGDPYPYVWSTPRVGAYGRGRIHESARHFADKARPRTAEWIRDFAKLSPVSA